MNGAPAACTNGNSGAREGRLHATARWLASSPRPRSLKLCGSEKFDRRREEQVPRVRRLKPKCVHNDISRGQSVPPPRSHPRTINHFRAHGLALTVRAQSILHPDGILARHSLGQLVLHPILHLHDVQDQLQLGYSYSASGRARAWHPSGLRMCFTNQSLWSVGSPSTAFTNSECLARQTASICTA